jgi:PPOX class probable F420-dependent enzyme
VALDPDVRRLAQAPNYAALTVHLPSGHAMTNVMWVDADDDHVLINTEVHRAKYRAVEKDQRATVMIWEDGKPQNFVEVRGRVVETVRGPDARAHIDKLAQKYTGGSYSDDWIGSERVILRIAPEVQQKRLVE